MPTEISGKDSLRVTLEASVHPSRARHELLREVPPSTTGAYVGDGSMKSYPAAG
jgi:hypothetical protein